MPMVHRRGVSDVAASGAKTFIPGPEGKPVMAECEAPKALSTGEVAAVVQDFARSAQLAKQAGFDGVEIHGANGYLMDQFRCPVLNHRQDQYGGSLENRYRLLLEIVDAVAQVYEPGRVAVRQSPYGVNNGMVADPEPMVTYPYLAAELNKRRIGFLHILDQSFQWIHDANHPLLPALRQVYSGTIIACGGFLRDQAEAILAAGRADLVAIGRPFIANPDLVKRFSSQAPLNAGDVATFYAGGVKGYTDYPTLVSTS